MGTFDSSGAFMPMKVFVLSGLSHSFTVSHHGCLGTFCDILFNSLFFRRVAKRQSWRRSWSLKG